MGLGSLIRAMKDYLGLPHQVPLSGLLNQLSFSLSFVAWSGLLGTIRRLLGCSKDLVSRPVMGGGRVIGLRIGAIWGY